MKPFASRPVSRGSVQPAAAALAAVLGLVLVAGPAAAQDADGDRIPDSIENQAWYQQAGGSPDRADVWVECDFMKKSVKKRGKLRRRAEEVFDRAPAPAGGIALHLDFDDKIPFSPQWGDLGTDEGILELIDEVQTSYEQRFDASPFTGANADTMAAYVHYCMFVQAIDGDGTSGFSFGIPGEVFLVSLGQYKGAIPNGALRMLETGTFLHELGHNLGLSHGGAKPQRHATFKPNYLSVMNYHFQIAFVRNNNGVAEYFNYWDYSRGEASRVNEKKLREANGVSLTPDAVWAATPQADELVGLTFCDASSVLAFRWNAPVDFNCNGSIDAGPVKVDTNLDDKTNKLGGGKVDWERLIFNGPGSPAQPRVFLDPQEELDRDDVVRLLDATQEMRLAPQVPVD